MDYEIVINEIILTPRYQLVIGVIGCNTISIISII